MNNQSLPFLPQWRVFSQDSDIQTPFDVAVVLPTIGRPEIINSIKSVYAQSNTLRIQLLVGLDRPIENAYNFELLTNPPKHVTTCFFYPGYSTNFRHGGVHPTSDGGALRCTLTHLANSQYITYLDDDNWWAETHLLEMLSAIQGRDWAFSLRWFVHNTTKQKICIDTWESVGPGKGVFNRDEGGFVDPNCLIINKLTCWRGIIFWNQPYIMSRTGNGADRNIFHFLSQHSIPGETKNATAYYVINPNDLLHPYRLKFMGEHYQEAENNIQTEVI